jgi:hypothetical protein
MNVIEKTRPEFDSAPTEYHCTIPDGCITLPHWLCRKIFTVKN